LVQEQIESEISGVLFTVNPVTGEDRETVVEAVPGLGESLVCGLVQPDRYLVDGFSGKVLSRSTSTDPTGIFIQPEGGTRIERKFRTKPLLDDSTVLSLARFGVEIQAFYGFPQDLEWTLAGGQIYILQARPITSISYQGIVGEWTTADFRDGGISAEVPTSFMWSLYEHVWESAIRSYLETLRLIPRKTKVQWSRVFFGRPYWNVGAVKGALSRLPGYKERNLDKDLGIEITYEGEGGVTCFTLRSLLQAIPVLVASKWNYANQYRRTKKAVRKFEQYARDLMDKDLSATRDEDLWNLFADLVHHRHFELETAYFKTVFNTSNARLDFKYTLDAANRRGAGIQYLPLLVALKPLKPLLPLHTLWQMSRSVREDEEETRVLKDGKVEDALAHPKLGEALSTFLKIYGHHSTRELDIRVPRWYEDPSFPIDTLKTYVKLDHDQGPEEQAIENRKRFEREFEKSHQFFSGLRRFHRISFMRKLRRVRFHTWYKEEVREQSTKMYALIRRVSLEVGRRLVQKGILDAPEDLFWLPYQKVIALTQGVELNPESIRRFIQANRNYALSFRNFKNPNEVGARWHYKDRNGGAGRVSGPLYQGIACASGQASGPARIIQDINEARKIRKGDILVTRFTDPGWTPLFSLISGVITETGGILSHAAVIAREYGIPAVLSVTDVTKRLKENQMVIVDGNSGEVRVVC
jgi:pyruvate,water dikinase